VEIHREYLNSEIHMNAKICFEIIRQCSDNVGQHENPKSFFVNVPSSGEHHNLFDIKLLQKVAFSK
jgi:hypothetical protein